MALYYHKVVDCQWACPAHTNVPEYIRLIAQGRYTESYMLNRESNVFPGILSDARATVRASLPAAAGASTANPSRILSTQTRGRGPSRRHHGISSQSSTSEKWETCRLDRCRPDLAHRGQRPHASRLRGHDLREARRARRTDADQHSVISASGIGARRRSGLHPRHGRGHSVQLARHESAFAGR